jgi:hypothetical protein
MKTSLLKQLKLDTPSLALVALALLLVGCMNSPAQAETMTKNQTTDEPANMQIAPDTHVGKTLALTVLHSASDTLPPGSYPSAGSLILQTYHADGTYTGIGHGPGTVDHHGTYSLVKISDNTLEEKTNQIIPSINYSANYVLEYEYATAYSGTWKQDFSNGLIEFSGTFTIF